MIDSKICEQATGCIGAGDYRQWAQEQGYQYCEVLDWTSSAGDWTFIVSEDGNCWYVMWQENNWPRVGFTREVGSIPFYGTLKEVIEAIVNERF